MAAAALELRSEEVSVRVELDDEAPLFRPPFRRLVELPVKGAAAPSPTPCHVVCPWRIIRRRDRGVLGHLFLVRFISRLSLFRWHHRRVLPVRSIIAQPRHGVLVSRI